MEKKSAEPNLKINQSSLSSNPPADTQVNKPPMSKLVYVFIALLVLLVLTVGATAAVYISKSLKPKNTSTSLLTPTPKATSTPMQTVKESYEEDTNIPGQKRYVSPKLGISFLYLPNQNGQTAAVKEDGNTLYVYIKELITDGKKDNYKGGQWIQVFQKDASVSLADAIKQQTLKGYSEKDCFVVANAINSASNHYPKTYETTTISFPKPTDDSVPAFAVPNNCPPAYTESNGIAYFLMDTNFPDRFTYLSIGQYLISASKDQGWQDTVQFLPHGNLISPTVSQRMVCKTSSDCAADEVCAAAGPVIQGAAQQMSCWKKNEPRPL